MPAWKKKAAASCYKDRDFWGDETDGEKFKRNVEEAFGTGRGSRKRAMNGLDLDRRIMNMYFTGERRIPNEVWERLNHHLVEWDEDEIDPLS